MNDLKESLPGLTRRNVLRTALIFGGIGLLEGGRLVAEAAEAITLPFERGRRPLVAFPQKRPLMVMTTRPPQLETPFQVFNEGVFTPNDAFFVRWHVAGIPTSLDLNSFRLKIFGRVQRPLSLSLDDLKHNFGQTELAAVCQCAGNSRGFSEPRVAGGQWGHGAMGNAVWKGVRLRDILDRAGLEKTAVQIRFNGLDEPVADGTPDFRKSLDVEVALGEHVLVAYEMNGEPLPWLNGYPLRLVVPGWYATYWIKMVHEIEVLNSVDQEFWMAKAYRVPADPCGCVPPGQKPGATVPIGRMTVRSFITNWQDGASIPTGQSVTVKGIAFDQGHGVDRVLFSADGGRHWQTAELGKDHGNFSFRAWEARFTPTAQDTYHLQSLAINRIGEAQRTSPRWNPGGYLRNAVETIRVNGI